MKKVLQNPEGKRVVIDTTTDVKLFNAPRNPPNTGTTYTTGTDLYYHKSRKGNDYFYFYSWSMWQGSEDNISLCSKNEAEEFLLSKAGKTGWDCLDETEIENLKEYGFDLLVEDA